MPQHVPGIGVRVLLAAGLSLGIGGLPAAEDWYVRTTGDGTGTLLSVASSGSEYLAVGADGFVMSSLDGRHWRATPGLARDLNHVIWSGADEGFVAVGAGGTVAGFSRSEFLNGHRSVRSYGNTAFNAIATNGSRFVVVGDDGTIMKTFGDSPSGFYSVTSGTTQDLRGVTWTGSYWIAVGDGGIVLRSSSSASTWTELDSATTGGLRSVAYHDGIAVAAGSSGIHTSTRTASTWTSRTGGAFYDVAWDGSQWVATGYAGRVATSPDGIQWTTSDQPVGATLRGVTAGKNGWVAVGTDTVVRSEQGTDWFRVFGQPAALGDVHFLNGRFVMGTENAMAAFSDDGSSWTESAVRSWVSGSRPWRGAIWTGSHYVLASAYHLDASEDGTTWTEVGTRQIPQQYEDLAWNGTMGVAVGSDGLLQTSEDGRTWTNRSAGPWSDDFIAVEWTGTVWLVLGRHRVISSEDGVTWTERVHRPSETLVDLAWTGNGAVVLGSRGSVSYSPDSLSWNVGALTDGPSLPSVQSLHVAGPSVYARGISGIWESTDGGATWTRVHGVPLHSLLGHDPADPPIQRLGTRYWQFRTGEAVPFGTAGTDRSLRGLHWDGERLVAVGVSGTILSSLDACVWLQSETGFITFLSDVTKSDTTWVIVGDDGLTFHSEDGESWRARSSGSPADLRRVCWAGSRFVVVGTGGTVLTSPDGLTWTPQPTPVSTRLEGVAWNGTRIVAVGDDGVVLSSDDGTTWTEQASPTTRDLTGVVWAGAQFVACGPKYGGGVIVTSPDGIVWTAGAESHDGRSIAWNGAELVMVDELASRSSDGLDWSSELTGTVHDLHDVEWMGDQWVAVGDSGTVLTSGGYSNWLLAEGIPPSRSGENDDFNSDGIPNLIAYAGGIAGALPAAPEDRARFPFLGWNSLHNGWFLTFRQFRDIPVNLVYTVEESTDGDTWTEVASTDRHTEWPPEVRRSLPDGYYGGWFAVSVPVEIGSGSKFWRLRVDR